MFSVEESIDIHASAEQVFDLIHDYDRRLSWDPFLKRAQLQGATRAGLGVKALCVAKNRLGGLAMETVYVSFHRPRVAAVKMTRGPAILAQFAASLRQIELSPGVTRVTYRLHCETRPRLLRGLLDPIARWLFVRETRLRLAALKQALEIAP
jgi:hypothetical protein